MNSRQRLFEVLNTSEAGDPLGQLVDYSIITLILANVLALLLGTVAEFKPYEGLFDQFEAFSVAFFTIEYLLRIWVAPVSPKYRGFWRQILRPFSLIDLLALLPFYAPFLGIDLRVVRVLRAFRLLRLLKLARYMRALDRILAAVKSVRHELAVANGMVLVLILIISTTMYYIEREAQPDAFSNAFQGIWWGVATLTTVGYGDIYPITAAGKALTAVASLIALGLITLPTSILTAAIQEGQQKHRNSLRPPSSFCPYCQGDGQIDDEDDLGLTTLKKE